MTPPPGAEILPDEKPKDKHEALMGVAASYGLYVEYGTAHSHAQPYVHPAADASRSKFEQKVVETLEAAFAKVK